MLQLSRNVSTGMKAEKGSHVSKKICASKFSVETVSFVLLSIVLVLRYPVHFILWPPYLMDFEVYRAAAERLLHGQGAHLYDPTTASGMMVFKYAPAWALFFISLGWLSKPAAAVLWTALNIAALLATLVLSTRLCRRHGIGYYPLTAVLAVLILVRPLAEEMGNGQANLLWGCLTVASVYAATVQRPWCSAAAIAAAILLKLPALIFLLYLFLRRQWAAIGRILVLLIGATMVASVLVAPMAPWHLLRSWVSALAHSGTTYTFTIGNQSFLALLGRFLTEGGYRLNLLNLSHSTIAWLNGIVGLIIVLRVGWPTPETPRRPERFVYDSALLMVVMVIFSPSCWLATYTALLFPVFLGCAGLRQMLTEHQWEPVTLILSGLVVLLSLFTNHRIWRFLNISSWHGETYLFLVFMVLPWLGLALIGLLWRQRQAHAQLAASRASSAGTSGN